MGEELILAEAGPVTKTTDIIKGSWTTVKKYGDSYMHTRLTTITPGIKNTFKVDDNEFDIKIPEEGKQAKCIIWGDPCISSKFVGCSFGKYFDAYGKSVKMLNSLAEADDGYDCFIMLGDNFYVSRFCYKDFFVYCFKFHNNLLTSAYYASFLSLGFGWKGFG